MKTRFSTLDIIAILPELKSKLCTGWRVNQIYDCDSKTYLFKLNKSIVQMKKDDDPLSVDEETANKLTFIIESGLRMHTTAFDWPKSHAPSSFATKLRKHIRNKRIEDIRQVGIDRLVDIKFGSNLAANHLIIELYDRGNLVLTDNNYSILHILRWRKPIDKAGKPGETGLPDDSENFRVGQRYPIDKCRKLDDLESMSEERIIELLNNAKIILGSNQNYKKRNKNKEDRKDGMVDINLKDLFNPYVVYGSSLLEDKLLNHISTGKQATKKCVIQIPMDEYGRLNQERVKYYAGLIQNALCEADQVLQEVKTRNKSPGYIVQKKQSSDSTNKVPSNKKGKGSEDEPKSLITNIDFFPILSCAERKVQQESHLIYEEFDSFDKAVDVYYCNIESQKLDSKTFVAEKEAQKRLEKLKISHEKRLEDLAKAQKEDEERARLIEMNSDKVENALLIIRSMIANQVPWSDIWKTIKDAQAMKDPIASLIVGVKFDRNEFTMRLSDPYNIDSGEEKEEEDLTNNKRQKSKKEDESKFKHVDIDISLSAYANARRFFVKRRTAVNKERKTKEVSKKAFKNVERRTKEMLKEVVVTANITKARKRYWFENFFWFISSDGYLVVAGRDAEQNDLLVKRYMKNNDIYVHADLHGASSVIVKNESSDPVPPKTLTEAGSMAVCYSSAWDSKMATTSWWVYPKQVSKTAPAGEYLSVGAFMIRGKKNFLPLSNLVLGFGFLFRLEEESIERRKATRLAREANAVINQSVSEHEEEDADASDGESIAGQESDQSDSDSSSDHQRKKPEQEKNLVAENDVTTEDVIRSDDDEDDVEGENKVIEHRLIDTMTESPLPDDVLLHAISMCGPYTAFQSFKYKVKVIPGTNKRGKAAKACLGMFLHDKRASQRERDLLRALKDQDYARNIPNKVKISAANKKILTKKKPKKSEVRLPL